MRGAGLLMVLFLTGCGGEASFDERYGKAEKDIRAKAKNIDTELQERERQAAEAMAWPTPGAATTD